MSSTRIDVYHSKIIHRPDGGVLSISNGSIGAKLSSGQSKEYSVTLPDTLHSLEFAVRGLEHSP
jgi:hypothetical protein